MRGRKGEMGEMVKIYIVYIPLKILNSIDMLNE